MTLFVDASALVAIILDEAEAATLVERITDDPDRLTNGVALWEAARAVARTGTHNLPDSLEEVERYRQTLNIVVAPIGTEEATEAVMAQHRYGKGTGHPARLNMGDCFAYACARTHCARLLYKGDDFHHTDLG